MQKLIRTFLVLLAVGAAACLANNKQRTYQTKAINQSMPIIDGLLHDTAWESVEWAGDFVQHEPYNGKQPSQQTTFKILFDQKNIYVAVRALDTEAQEIEARLSRRDDIQGDFIGVQLDSYYDKQTAFTFIVSAAGVKSDAVFSGDGENEDWSVDLVWYAKVTRDNHGWNAELRIPLSQLRYGNKKNHTWGMQIARQIFRNQEMSLWQPIAQEASGWIHHFGNLQGIGHLPKLRRIEVLPYTVARAEGMEKETGNPFQTGRSSGINGGIDGKIGITSDITLDFTINPDFGQVEADPSEVNLTAYESFFQEKRPFFIEGRNIFSYQVMMGDGDIANDNLFYSRRIGRRPAYFPDTVDDEYVDMPNQATILGAMKLSGKMQNGISIGVMDAVTQSEQASVDLNGQRRKVNVEPTTNYFLGRVQKDFRNGATRLGSIITHTHRNIKNDHLDFLNDNALTAGIDFHHEWKDRTWFIDFKGLFSHISGSTEAMIRQQRSPRRYYHRIDNDYRSLDSTLTSMSGHGGGFFIGRSGNSHVNFGGGGTWRSPGVELNDMGYMREADMVLQFTWVGLRWWEPFFIFRNVNINFNQYYATNWGRDKVVAGGNTNFNVKFKNYWSARLGFNINSESLSTSALRGGPALLQPASRRMWWGFNSDNRKPVTLGMGGGFNSSSDGIGRGWNANARIHWRPNESVSVSINPFFNQSINNLQYVTTEAPDDNDRYVFGRIDRKTMGMVFRLNYSITPDLSIQFYAQPFVSAGKYSHYKQITDSRAANYDNRFHEFTEQELSLENDVYQIDKNIDGEVDYSFDKPDFNFHQFHSNLVIRWEYHPGSTIFLVWSQGRTGYIDDGSFHIESDMQDLFRVHPHNVFLLKVNRWFSIF
ncbi:carbohydrate binding family 9 domain-containing protein [bacterium]|nr:carbohydrate binding family 9 domain-containing protein [bacterium]